ncbi:tetratricopeptide repeat protein [Clostridium sp. CAG:505]|nr:tetratricopeptide repeat protein [Clostridium sp. CAG:505]
MGFYFAEVRKLRRELQAAYGAGEYKKALILGKNILQKYMENDDANTMEYASDMHNLGVIFDTMGMYPKAVEYYKKAAVLKRDCSGESLSYADTVNNLAIAYNNMGEGEKARRFHGEVLKIREAKLGKDHPDTIYSLFHLGNTEEDLQQYEKAVEYHQQALERARRSTDFSKEDMADIFASLGSAYDGGGNYRRSISSYEKALDFMEKAGVEESFCCMIWTLSLAEVCEKAGWNELAVEYCEKAVRMRRKMMQDSHLDYINSLNSLGILCCKAGMFEKSLQCHEEVLKLVREVLGGDHLFYADTLNNMSADYSGMGQMEKALEANEEALRRKEAALGEYHAQVAVCYMSRGRLYEKMGRDTDALAAYEKALLIRRDTVGRMDPLYADTLEQIAGLFTAKGAYEAAAEYLQEALYIRREAETGTDRDLVGGLQLLADVKQKAGEGQAAAALCREAIELLEKHFSKNHPEYAIGLAKLGEILAREKQYDEAIQILTESAAIQKEMLDEDNPRYLKTLEYLAEVCVRKGDYAVAVQHYLAINDANYEETAEEKQRAAETLLAVAVCYLAMGNEKKAEAYRKEAVEKLNRAGGGLTEKFAKSHQQYDMLANKGKLPYAGAERQARMEERRRLQKAKDLFTEMLAQRGEQAQSLDKEAVRNAISLGDLQMRTGNREQAFFWYQAAEQAAEGMEYAQACRRLGEWYLTAGEYLKGLQKLTNAKNYIEEYDSVKTKDYCELLAEIGDCYFAMGEKEKAVSMYLPYIRLFRELQLPRGKQYQRRLERTGRLLADSGRHKDAAECFSELALATRMMEGETENFARLLLKTAASHIAQGNQKEAVTLLDRALLLGTAKGRDTEAYGKLCDRIGRMYAANGSLERAEDCLSIAYEMTRNGKKCLTRDGLAALLSVLRKLGQEERYFAVKQGKKLE